MKPVVGRLLRPDDDQLGAAPVVILGGGFWSREFGSSPEVLGKSLTLNGTSYQVVGVIPAGFTFYGHDRDVYIAIGRWNDPSFHDRRISVSARVIGRSRKPGVTYPQARADMDVVARNLAAEFPVADKDVGITLVSMKEDIVGNVEPYLLVLLAAVGFLLLIACTNVANLLLARAMGRSREFAVRTALGAGHARLIRQFLTESIFLASLGGALGLLLAYWATRKRCWAVCSIPPLPRAEEITLDGRECCCSRWRSRCLPPLYLAWLPALEKFTGESATGVARKRTGMSGARCGQQRLLRGRRSRHGPGAADRGGADATQSLRAAAGGPGIQPGACHHIQPFDAVHRGHHAGGNGARGCGSSTTKCAAFRGVQAVSVTLGSRPMIHDSSLPFWIGRAAQAGGERQRNAPGHVLPGGSGIPASDGNYAAAGADS